MTRQRDRAEPPSHVFAISHGSQQGPELRKVRLSAEVLHGRLGYCDLFQIRKGHPAIARQEPVQMILMGVSQRQDGDRSWVDCGFRHGLLETTHSWSPASASTVDENAVNARSGERKAIDRQTELGSCQRGFLHRSVMRVAQKVCRHIEVAVRERPDTPRPRRAMQDIVSAGSHDHDVTCREAMVIGCVVCISDA
jgi:hypothetical protein